MGANPSKFRQGKRDYLCCLDDCPMGILSLNAVDNCVRVTTNQVLCAVEISIGLLLLPFLIRQIRRVFFLLQAMLVFYSIQALAVIVICAISLSQDDHTLEGTYVVLALGYTAFAFAISSRLFVFAKVVYLSSSINRSLPVVASLTFVFLLAFLFFASNHSPTRAREPDTWKIGVLLFGVATIVSLAMLILWMFTPLYAPSGTVEFENFHRAGFIVFGVYALCFAIALASVSRHVIKLYVE